LLGALQGSDEISAVINVTDVSWFFNVYDSAGVQIKQQGM
jgi:hypothetical protein